MTVIDAIEQRHSVRAFSNKDVSKEQIEELLNAASKAPTGGNMQPWSVAVVKGASKQALSEAYTKVALHQTPNPDLPYYSEQMPQIYQYRRHVMGTQIYQSKNIDISNEKHRDEILQLQLSNYNFFGAPVGLLLFIHRELSHSSLLDIGMFMQNIMLYAQQLGLATCSQASWGNYPDEARRVLDIKQHQRLLCGMSIGYEDLSDPINTLRRIREPTKNFTVWKC